jgi:hypothetical protein
MIVVETACELLLLASAWHLHEPASGAEENRGIAGHTPCSSGLSPFRVQRKWKPCVFSLLDLNIPS